MSRHCFRTAYRGRTVEVVMGWDRPLGGYFLTVLDLESGEYVFNNLDEEESHPRSLMPFLARLSSLGLCVPERMIAEVQVDGMLNVGNRLVDWT